MEIRQILLRTDTAANWSSEDPVLGLGEVGTEWDTGRHKVGDGAANWTALPYGRVDLSVSRTSTAVTIGVSGDDAILPVASTTLAGVMSAADKVKLDAITVLGDASTGADNVFSGSNSFYNASGQVFGTDAAAEDGLIVAGRPGGTSSYRITLLPQALSGNQQISFPDRSGTVLTTADVGTITSAMLADGTIVNADISASAAIADTKLATIATAGKVANSATTAASANTASAIVSRDASGNFAASTITAALNGNASTASILQTARSINGVSFNGSADITLTANTSNSLTFNDGGAGAVSGTAFTGAVARTVSYNSIGAPSVTGTNASGTWGISVTGNAATATTLQTARTLWGQSFNGSANISGNLTGVGNITGSGEITLASGGTDQHVTINTSGTGSIILDTGTAGGTVQLKGGASGTRIYNAANTHYTSFNIEGLTANRNITLADGATTLVAGTMVPTTGSGASGTWGINITGSSASCTGNAATATTATSAVTPSFSGDSVGKDNITTRTESGFYETSTGTTAEGWPTNSNGWHHLISCTHTNDTNYFAMQLASRFDTQDWYLRNTNGNGATGWSTMLHSGNYNTYAPTLTGGGASGTWGINITGNCSGNAATVTNGMYLGTVQTVTAQKSFQTSNSGMASASGGLSRLEVYGGGGGAFMTFHRPGVYASYFGLDSDNVWKVGGWSAGAAAYPILHSNNYNSYAPTLTGGNASGTWNININGRGYPRNTSTGGDMNFYWSGQGGQPNWLWGGNDGVNFFVYNPSNFSVNYANSAGFATNANDLYNAIAIGAYSFSVTNTTQRISGQAGTLHVCSTDTDTSSNTTTIQRVNSNGRAIRFARGTGSVGDITINTSSISVNGTSDYRLKENITPLADAVNRLKNLSPCRFNFIAEPGNTIDGFLAHEVQPVVPEAVRGEKDAMEPIGAILNADGSIAIENIVQPSPSELEEGQHWEQTGEQPDYQGMDNSKLVPLLTAALQELVARVEALESA